MDSELVETGRRRFGGAAYLAGTVVLALVFALLVAKCSKPEPKNRPSAIAASPPTTSASQVPKAWSAVTLVDGAILFGHLQERATEGLHVLQDAYFISSGGKDVNSLKRFGTELHMPLPQLMLPARAVAYVQPLADGSPVVGAIAEFEEDNPPDLKSVLPLPKDSVQAVFLRTNEVFFGKVRLEAGSLVFADAYFLKFKDDMAATAGQIESLDQVVLVHQSDTRIRPTGELRVPLDCVLYFQTLSGESPVVKAMAEEK